MVTAEDWEMEDDTEKEGKNVQEQSVHRPQEAHMQGCACAGLREVTVA